MVRTVVFIIRNTVAVCIRTTIEQWYAYNIRTFVQVVSYAVTVAVQLNGKLRGTIQLPKDVAKDEAEKAALALPELVRGLDGKTPRRVVVVPNRIVNVVV